MSFNHQAPSGQPHDGARVRLARVDAGLSLREVGARAGIPHNVLAKHENGSRRFPLNDAERVMGAIAELVANKARRASVVQPGAELQGDAATEDAPAFLASPPVAESAPENDDHEPVEPPGDWRATAPAWIVSLTAGRFDEAAEKASDKQTALLAKRYVAAMAKEQSLSEAAMRKELIKVRATLSGRLIAARKINGWDQEEAARRLFYANSTQLSLLESGAREIRLEHVMKAATAYRVSTDFLIGRADVNAEADSRTLIAERVAGGLRTVADVLIRHVESSEQTLGGPTVETIRTLIAHARAVAAAASRVDGPALDSIRGGSSLAYAVSELELFVVEVAQAVAGHTAKKERLLALLRIPPSNDAEME